MGYYTVMNWADRIQTAVRDSQAQRMARLKAAAPVAVMPRRAATTATAAIPQTIAQSYTDRAAVYAGHVWVNRAVNLIRAAFAPLVVQVVTRGDEELLSPGHPVSQRLGQQLSAEYWGQWIVDVLLGGEAFTGIPPWSDRVTRYWLYRPDLMLVLPDATPSPYPVVAGYALTDDPYKVIPIEEVWHFKLPNPVNAWRGLSPLSAVANSVTIDALAQTAARNLLANGMRPDYALVAPTGLTPSEREEYRYSLARHQGVDNVHEPIILEQGIVDIKPLGLTPRDMEWIEQRRVAANEIAAVFGIPDGLMGLAVEAYDTATKLDGDMRAFWELAILPYVRQRDQSLTDYMQRIGALTPDEQLVTGLEGVPVLQDNFADLLQQGKALRELGYTADQVNERLGLGMPPAPAPVVPVEMPNDDGMADDPEDDPADNPNAQAIAAKIARRRTYGKKKLLTMF